MAGQVGVVSVCVDAGCGWCDCGSRHLDELQRPRGRHCRLVVCFVWWLNCDQLLASPNVVVAVVSVAALGVDAVAGVLNDLLAD